MTVFLILIYFGGFSACKGNFWDRALWPEHLGKALIEWAQKQNP